MIDLPIDQMVKFNITPAMYFFIYCMVNGIKFPWGDEKYKKELQELLVKTGFIFVSGDTIQLRGKSLILFNIKNNKKKDVDTISTLSQWIDDWRDLWPKGHKSGNRLVKGDRNGIINKMKSFLKRYPEISKEEIFAATQNYISESTRNGSYDKYMQCADYFIEKHKVSQLSAYIEQLDVDDGDETKDSWSQTFL